MDNNGIPETKIHSYNVSVAADTKNINAAVIFHNICFWVEQNYANERNFINGKYWTYNTVKAFRTMFPEMTANQISYALQKLEEKGYIESAFLCEDTRDRTKWYTVCDFDKWIHVQKSNSGISDMAKENSNMGAENSEIFNNNINTKDTDTDNKPTDNSHRDKTLSNDNVEAKTSFSENRKKMSSTKTALEKYLGKKADEQGMLARMAKICKENYDMPEAIEIYDTIQHYFDRYTQKTGLIHPILTDKTLKRMAEKMDCFYDSEYSHFEQLIGQDHAFMKMVDMFFDGDFGANNGNETNYNLPAFMTDGVLNPLGQRLFELGEVE